MLLNVGADPDKQNINGKSVLEHVINIASQDWSNRKLYTDNMKLLVAKADISSRDNSR